MLSKLCSIIPYVGRETEAARLGQQWARVYMWPSSITHFPRPHACMARTLPSELVLHLFAGELLGGSWRRWGRGYHTSACSMWGVLIAFTEVWPPSGGISH